MKTASFQQLALKALGLAGAAGGVALAAAVAVQGAPRSSVHPYLEIQEVLSADFNGGDVLTYTSVGGGVDANVATRRVQATISYNYQRRIALDGKVGDSDVHSGIAAARVAIVPNMLNFDAGALAARSHADIRNPVPALRTVDSPGLAEVYSVYAGPTLSTKVGALDVGASYRLGYVAVDDHSVSGGALPAGTPRPDRYDNSLVQSAAASVGIGPGRLPVGWTVGAGWEREDSDRLDARYEGKYVRGDVVVPVSGHLAVTGGVGYEKIQSSQQDVVRGADGIPVITPGGDLIPDPSRPRLLAYDQSGLIWDVGVIWRPSRHTELQARVGRRYGGTTFTGSLEHRINEAYGVSVSVYDSVGSFGRLLVTDLAGVPTAFDTGRFNSALGGAGICVFGNDPGTGTCLDSAFQSISNFTFRTRGVNALLSGGRGPWNFGVGAGFNQRRYFAPPQGNVFVLDGVTDESFTVQASAARRLSRTSGINLDAYAGWFDSGRVDAGSSWNSGITAGYHRNILNERLQANVAAGLYHTDAGEFDSSVGSILFGLRYTF